MQYTAKIMIEQQEFARFAEPLGFETTAFVDVLYKFASDLSVDYESKVTLIVDYNNGLLDEFVFEYGNDITTC